MGGWMNGRRPACEMQRQETSFEDRSEQKANSPAECKCRRQVEENKEVNKA
jgi:hypothetical protein